VDWARNWNVPEPRSPALADEPAGIHDIFELGRSAAIENIRRKAVESRERNIAAVEEWPPAFQRSTRKLTMSEAAVCRICHSWRNSWPVAMITGPMRGRQKRIRTD
jgi:hypothetical protein